MGTAQFILAIIIVSTVGLLVGLGFLMVHLLSKSDEEKFTDGGGGWAVFGAVVLFCVSSIGLAVLQLVSEW